MGDHECIALLGAHLTLFNSGKVRTTFCLDHEGHKYLLAYVSNRASVFDFKLGAPIARKGEVLNACNILMRKRMEDAGIEHDLIAWGKGIDLFLEGYPQLQGKPDLWRQCVVIDRLEMIKKEIIIRGALTGHGWEAYEEAGAVSGHHLLPGLRNGQLLGRPLPTPSTKGEDGEHDELIDYRGVERLYPGLLDIAIRCYEVGHAPYWDKGIFMADTKFEFGRRWVAGKPFYVLADETCTPDSSRFWFWQEYLASWPDALPRSFDKDPLRRYVRWVAGQSGFDINALDPKNPQHQELVKSFEISEEVGREVFEAYHTVFQALGGMTLDEFWVGQGIPPAE